MAILLSVLSSLLVGIVLVFAPWSSLWDANYMLQPNPLLRSVVLSAFTRGAVTGLGLVNIVLAFEEAHQHLARGGEGA